MTAECGRRAFAVGSVGSDPHCRGHFLLPNQECVWSREMSVDNSTMKLGKRPQRHDVRTLKLARYLTGAGQAQPLQPPASVDYTHGMKDW